MARPGGRKSAEEHPWRARARILAQLGEGRLAPAYVLRGEERYFRESIADAVAQAAAAAGLEVCRHDAKHPEFRLAGLLDDLEGNALFARARCVLLHAAPALVSKSSKSYCPAVEPLLLARMRSGDGGTLVVAGEGLRADHSVVKAARALDGEVVVCRRLWEGPPPSSSDPRDAELVRWLLGRAAAIGVELGPDEAVYLAQATGNDLFALEAELERLRERGGAALRELVVWQAGASPFDVAEALTLGRLEEAVQGIEALFLGGALARGARATDGGAVAKMLLNALYSKAREGLRGASLVAAGASPEQAAEQCGVAAWPKAREAFRIRLRTRGAQEWLALLDEIAALERRQHTGTSLDAGDFARLALRWRKRAGRSRTIRP